MPDDEEVQENIGDENLSRPRSKAEFDDEDEEIPIEYEGKDLEIEEEFVRISPFKR